MTKGAVALADPTEMGVSHQALEAIRAAVRHDVEAGILPSCQFALGRENKLLAFETFGNADNHNRYAVFSTTKGIVFGAVMTLITTKQLDVSAPVADFLPSFRDNGKNHVTIEQVMTHTGGFPLETMPPSDWNDPLLRHKRFQSWQLSWAPGSTWEYHAASAYWVIAALIEKISGSPFPQFLEEHILRPLDLPYFTLGVPVQEQAGILPVTALGHAAEAAELMAYFGREDIPVGTATEAVLLTMNDPERRTVGAPGDGGVGTAADLALYYQALLHNPHEIWAPDVLTNSTGQIRNNMPDPFLGMPAQRTLGLVLAGTGKWMVNRGFGTKNSPQSFGHPGAGGQIAWADPRSGLSFSYLTNGLDRNLVRQQKRILRISNAAALCTD